ncbi:FeoC-like transcriptional regulator [Vibrio sp. AK197]|uniref:FeoC-like transcriptional regulator n=1 Tax=Vibrio olivae TaxID=1243002 RepID=A0ABV5HKU5_9VIBR
MILSELKQYILEHHGASSKQLAKRFGLSEDGVDAMLSVWIRKGQISKMVDTNRDQRVTNVRYVVNPSHGLSLTVTM